MNNSSTLDIIWHTPTPWSTEERVLLALFYILAIVFSASGNVIVIVTFSVGKNSKTDIRGFFISLAVSDLLVGIWCLPLTFTDIYLQYWTFPGVVCPIMTYLQNLAVISSVFTNSIIGWDRFCAILYPLRRRAGCLWKKRYIISAIWGSSLLLSMAPLFTMRGVRVRFQETSHRIHFPLQGSAPFQPNVTQSVFSLENMNSSIEVLMCQEQWSSSEKRAYTLYLLVITYVLPLSVLLLTYSMITFHLWRRTLPGEANRSRDKIQLKAKIKVIKMLILICTLFALCWLPLHVFFIILEFHPNLFTDKHVEKVLYATFLWLAMSNSSMNPVIYGFLNDGFRKDFVVLCQQMCPVRCFSSQVNRFTESDRRCTTGISRTQFPSQYRFPKSHELQITDVSIKRSENHEDLLESLKSEEKHENNTPVLQLVSQV